MHKKLLIISVALLFFQSCYEIQRNCNDFKTGRFAFTYAIDGENITSQFERTLEYNIDYVNGVADSSSIRWINDCEFILKKLHPKNMQEEKAIHMKILSTTDSSYTFQYRLAVKESSKQLRVEKGTALRIK